MTQKAVAMANTYTFYGQHFSKSRLNWQYSSWLTQEAGDKTFLEAALQYPRDVFIAAEVLRCVPAALAGPASWLATRGHKASKLMSAKLVPMIEDRLRCEKAQSSTAQVSNFQFSLRRYFTHHSQRDYVQYVIDLYPADVPNRAERIVEQTLALWFASVHQPAIVSYL